MQELLSRRQVKMLRATNAKSAIEQLGNLLVEEHAITAEYVSEVLDREKHFPTGLDFGHIKIAIPHATSSTHVLHTALAIGRVEQRLTFHSMEDNEQAFAVEIICLLAISDPLKHLEMLKKIMLTFQKKEIALEILQAKNEEELYLIFEQALK